MDNYLDHGIQFQRSPDEKNTFSYIGTGSPGGKGGGLIGIKAILDKLYPDSHFEGISVGIPSMTILLSDVFDQFLKQNNLAVESFLNNTDSQIALKFQKASLPPLITGDLNALLRNTKFPLAVRSSSLIEDSLDKPFAGVYATKMIPNNDPNPEIRFRKLVEAIKFVYASTWFKQSRDYFQSVKIDIESERMAVIIQEIQGQGFDDNFYPAFSGVARSWNFYPFGSSTPKDGIVELALGLGKTIVDGGERWSYSPSDPASPPPSSVKDLLAQSQKHFWALHLKPPALFNPLEETEYMLRFPVKQAETDGILGYLCSTYDTASDRLEMGLMPNGPRLMDFSAVLKGRIFPFNDLILDLLKNCETNLGYKVEIEFAVKFDPRKKIPPHFGFLQIRPMKISDEIIDFDSHMADGSSVLVYSDTALGNGIKENILDLVYIPPEKFIPGKTFEMASEIEKINSEFLRRDKKYILLGFGRWGSSDSWLGIPVNWSQISAADVLVESTLPDMNPDLSQGSHFFHNLSNLGIFYFSIESQKKNTPGRIDYRRLEKQKAAVRGQYFHHVTFDKPVKIIVDGKTNRGVILE